MKLGLFFLMTTLAISSCANAQEATGKNTALDFLQQKISESTDEVKTNCTNVKPNSSDPKDQGQALHCLLHLDFVRGAYRLNQVDQNAYRLFAEAFTRIVKDRGYISYAYMRAVIEGLVAERFTHQVNSILSVDNITSTFSKFYDPSKTVNDYGIDTNTDIGEVSQILHIYADKLASGEKASDLTYNESVALSAKLSGNTNLEKFIHDSDGHRYFSVNSPEANTGGQGPSRAPRRGN